MGLEKSFDTINESDIRQLLENQISERKTIEYKQVLPENKYDSKKEFLADVSSLANTAGGHILYGIKEENGIPVELMGISNNDLDNEILRLENLLRDGIQPRIQGISIKSIPVERGNPVIVIRVPQSWSKPHVVNFQGHWRFYARNSAGKYPLDVMELKSAFLATNALGEKIRNFHFDRLSKISSDEIPVHLTGKARIILHSIPYSAFESGQSISFTSIEKDIWSIPLIYSSVSDFRYNLDGLIALNERGDNTFGAYAQIYRNGVIESVSTRLFGDRTEDPYIPSSVFEEEIIKSLETCITLYQKLLVNLPFVLLVTFAGVQGYKLAVNQRLDTWHQHTHKIDRNLLLLPETIIEDFAVDPSTALRPIFDSVWNAAGWARSYGYNDAGEWGKGGNYLR